MQLVNDVLDMNRLETSGLEVEHKPFDIREVLRGCWTESGIPGRENGTGAGKEWSVRN